MTFFGAIQLQGRWGSDTTNKYLREAPLSHQSTTPVYAMDVDVLVEKLLPLLQHPVRLPRPAPTPIPAQSEQVEELLVQQASLVTGSSSSPASSDRALVPADLVVNLNSGFTHRAVSSSHAQCGWQFTAENSKAHMLSSFDDGPEVWDSCCGRCFEALFPEVREAAKSCPAP